MTTPQQIENFRRAERAYQALLAYGHSDAADTLDYTISDILTDLMHLAKYHGCGDFEKLVQRARADYEAEAEGTAR